MSAQFETFNFDGRLNIRFGQGAVNKAGNEVTSMGLKKVLVVTDPGCYKAGLHKSLLESLEKSEVETLVFYDVEPNPRDTTIHKGYEQAKKEQVQAVIGIGGGSPLDVAKGVALLLTNPGDIKDYNGQNKVKNYPVPIIAIPTTAGTGSEATANCALTDSQNHIKLSVRSPKLLPQLTILDPELLATIPQDVAAYSGMDALIHAIESYLSRGSNAFSEIFALKAIELIGQSLKPFYADPSNIKHGGNMLIGSMLAGLAISNTGTGSDHALARALGGEYDLPHGLACAIMFPAVLRFNSAACESKYLQIAKSIGFSSFNITPLEAGRLVVKEIEEMLRSLNLPTKLREVGVKEESFEALAKVAINNVKPNPRKTTEQDLIKLLKEAY